MMCLLISIDGGGDGVGSGGDVCVGMRRVSDEEVLGGGGF
jgi:hypothetical protein